MSTEHKAATEAAAHQATNARLCQWLGVEPQEWQLRCRRDGWQCARPSFDTQQEADKYRETNGHTDYDAVPIYPDLDTRENFWILWDALKTKPHIRPQSHSKLIEVEFVFLGCHPSTFVHRIAETPWAALYAAAVALMEREAGNRMKIYTASKVRHAPTWRWIRSLGIPINSTWIDEAGSGETSDWADLWSRCIREASEADVVLVYAASDDMILKGALVEVGAALAFGKTVLAVGISKEHTWMRHPLVKIHATVPDALLSLGLQVEEANRGN